MKKIEFEESSGNVFADLGLANADQLLLKAKLVSKINSIIREKCITQKAVGEILKIDQPKVSALLKGKFSGFSIERLLKFLSRLDHQVTIAITPKPISKKRTLHVNNVKDGEFAGKRR